MSQHTPGPWRVETDGSIENNNLANVINGADGTLIVYGQVKDAGAILIAAAPDLLDALRACDEAMSYMSEYDIPLTLPAQVKAAIAKATGGAA